MTYTTQQLQAMSNHEINCALAVKLNVDHYTATGLLFTAKKHDGDNVFSISGVTDYCNSPNDIMPLAFDRGIKLDCVACPAGSGFVYYAKSYDGELQSDYDSACRAIACLLLLMKD